MPAATERRGPDTTSATSYHPHLDGLRAVAVYLVLLFHAGSDRFDGGFIGVDVFFVLSGFLVTRLLLRDLGATGAINLRRFYARRFRRLLPASFVMLMVTALVFSAIATPIEVADAKAGFQASFLYVANWHFISESSDYFGADLTTNPVLHFWSLAVEEQFYVLWPLLLGGVFVLSRRAGDRQRRCAQGIVLAGALASVLWAWYLKGDDPNRAYYGTDTRAYQLLAGALIALTPGAITHAVRFRRAVRLASVGAFAGLVLVASSWIGLDAIERGVAVTVLAVVLIVALEAGHGGALQTVLSRDPVTYLGKISYGIYLWHWPVILIMARSFELSTTSTIILTALIATGLASLSYQLLEHPIRRSPWLDGHRVPVIAGGLAISIVSAIVVIPEITDSARRASAELDDTAAAAGFTPVPPGLNFLAIQRDFPALTNCFDEPADACTLVEGGGAHVLLIGDSHAGMMIPTFTAIAEEQDLTLSIAVRGGCPWQQGVVIPPVPVYGEVLEPEDCIRERNDVYDRVVPELDPDVIIAMNLSYEAPTQAVSYRPETGPPVGKNNAAYDALLDQATTDSVAALTSGGRHLVVLEAIPSIPKTNPLTCLSKAEVVEACRLVAPGAPTGLEEIYRRLDEDDDRMWSADIDRLVCPFFPICDPIVAGEVVRIDGSHLTSAFARTLAGPMTDYLTTNAIIP